MLKISQLFTLIFLVLGIFLIFASWFNKRFVIIGFCFLFLAGGIWRYQTAELKVFNNELRKHNDLDKKVILIGVISAEPDIGQRSQKLIIKVKELQNDITLYRSDDFGKVLVITNRYPEYHYGDKVRITGKLESPLMFNDFNYKDYLKKEGIYSQLRWPKIELLEQNQGNLIFAQILRLKEELRKSLNQNLSPPESSLLSAILLGDKRQMLEDLKNKLNVTGVRHITAVSGLHVTILGAILMSLLLMLGFWRQQAFYFSIILIVFYIIMTGFQPSSLRAGIMGGLFLLARYLGRQNTSSRTIVFAAAVMLFHNPFLLKLDIGFQLSFLAMLGIINLLPIFQDWLKFIPQDDVKNILAMTFSAYLFTLPILIYNFGYVSLIALLVNLLVVPVLYPVMLFGFLFSIVGIIFPLLGWILSWPAWLLLFYITTIVELFSKLPFAYLTIENLHWAWLIISYLILGLITWRLKESQKLKFLNY
jgi:competence protein ComEC